MFECCKQMDLGIAQRRYDNVMFVVMIVIVNKFE